MPVNRELPKKIVILGGGTAGWMAANWLSHHWAGQGVQISLIESSEIGIVGVGEGSTPVMRNFFRDLGISEQEWMPACNATFKAGISFPNWADFPENKSYFHPFFTHLDIRHGANFFDDVNLRRNGSNMQVHPNDYFITAALVRAKLSPIPLRKLEHEPDYAYHFDSALLGNFLRDRAIKLGVRNIVDTVEGVEQAETGDIAFLQTKAHGSVFGDFFIDCSGFASLLMGKTLNEPFKSFKDNLFNDSAVAIPTPLDNQNDIPVETISGALKFGWAWKIPLASRFGNGYVYDADFLTPEQAEVELRNHLGDASNNQPARHLKMRVGRIEHHWRNNCLALGLSQGFIEPLEATALMLVQFTIELFVNRYNHAESLDDAREQVNKKINMMFDGVRDYIVAHYHLNSRTDTDYWIANRSHKNLPDNLVEILEAWDSGVSFEKKYDELRHTQVYTRSSWYCLLAGMGRLPPTIAGKIPQRTENAIAAREYCDLAVRRLFPSHNDCLQNIYGSRIKNAK